MFSTRSANIKKRKTHWERKCELLSPFLFDFDCIKKYFNKPPPLAGKMPKLENLPFSYKCFCLDKFSTSFLIWSNHTFFLFFCSKCLSWIKANRPLKLLYLPPPPRAKNIKKWKSEKGLSTVWCKLYSQGIVVF